MLTSKAPANNRKPEVRRLLASHLLASRLLAAVLLAATGAVHSASLETMVMPGPVIEDHADIEERCGACHDLFDPDSQRGLCLECHEPVALDLAAANGFHGRDVEARSADCKQCHAEHKGRTADIIGLQVDLFNHELTDFPLIGAHRAQSCSVCHQPSARHAEAPADCNGCHKDDDAHGGQLGTACSDCHDPDRWQSARFDHATTDFSLSGSHADATCLSCHADRQFEPPGNRCADCHSLDDKHSGANGDACGDCHGTETWNLRFDHRQETGFALMGAHSLLTCQNCHVSEIGYSALPTECNDCHSGDDAHLGRNGTNCSDCHDQSEWATSFDHLAKTGFELAGAHGTLTCSACHTDGLEAPLATDCGSCHDRNDPHAGTLTDCGTCHGQSNWASELSFQHDLTDFALVGLHRVASCEQCHDSLLFAPLPHECTDCHATEDEHDGVLGQACEQCHNPAGWAYWRFDHGVRTQFALTGAHDNLTCVACHASGNTPARQSRACASCHRSDDVHRGGFGQNCDRCHLTTNFQELKRDI